MGKNMVLTLLIVAAIYLWARNRGAKPAEAPSAPSADTASQVAAMIATDAGVA